MDTFLEGNEARSIKRINEGGLDTPSTYIYT
jgi:hypothetical protein